VDVVVPNLDRMFRSLRLIFLSPVFKNFTLMLLHKIMVSFMPTRKSVSLHPALFATCASLDDVVKFL
jgi:hypothetical protein